MFYIVKILMWLCLPPSGLIFLMLLGFIILLTKYKKTGKGIITLSFLLFYALSSSFVSNFLISPLEEDYPPLIKIPNKVSAIVVLTGGVKDLSGIGLGSEPSGGSLARLAEGIRIFNIMKTTPLIICGGKGDPEKPELSEGKALAKKAVELGVPLAQIQIEDRSVNTIEGVEEVKKMLQNSPKEIILVSSAYHIGRAVQIFEKDGFKVFPAPTDHHAQSNPLSFYSFLPIHDYGVSATAIGEYLVRGGYATTSTVKDFFAIK